MSASLSMSVNGSADINILGIGFAKQQVLYVDDVSFTCTAPPPPPPPPDSTELVLAAAGDICGQPASCAAAGALLDSINPNRVLTLGDNQYRG